MSEPGLTLTPAVGSELNCYCLNGTKKKKKKRDHLPCIYFIPLVTISIQSPSF